VPTTSVVAARLPAAAMTAKRRTENRMARVSSTPRAKGCASLGYSGMASRNSSAASMKRKSLGVPK